MTTQSLGPIPISSLPMPAHGATGPQNGHADNRVVNRFASSTGFDKLTVDHLPSDDEEEPPKSPPAPIEPAPTRPSKKSKSKRSKASIKKTVKEQESVSQVPNNVKEAPEASLESEPAA